MAKFISTQAQLVIAARSCGYVTSNTKAERSLLCPQCQVEQAIMFHKEGKADVVACPCGHRGSYAVKADTPAPPVKAKAVKDNRCMAMTKKGTRCTRKAGPSGYCSIASHRPEIDSDNLGI